MLLAPPHQGTLPPKSTMATLAYIMSKNGAIISGTVATGSHFLNSKSFCVLFHSGAVH